MKRRFTETQIIGFLREAEAGVPVKQLCRKHGYSEASYYLWRSKDGGIRPVRCVTSDSTMRPPQRSQIQRAWPLGRRQLSADVHAAPLERHAQHDEEHACED